MQLEDTGLTYILRPWVPLPPTRLPCPIITKYSLFGVQGYNKKVREEIFDRFYLKEELSDIDIVLEYVEGGRKEGGGLEGSLEGRREWTGRDEGEKDERRRGLGGIAGGLGRSDRDGRGRKGKGEGGPRQEEGM
jgi:hypothetical protein